MKHIAKGILMGMAIAVSATGALAATEKVDLGKREYDANCASCHGMNGRGDGPNRQYLNRSPADLTSLAKATGGVLPVNRLYQSIGGEQLPAGHGSRDMPTWGYDYRIRAAEYYGDLDYDPNAFVRTRILALIEYIARLQAK
jgi:mono/diheme cytochrome c family protein